MTLDFLTPYFMDGLNIWAQLTHGINFVGLIFAAGFFLIVAIYAWDNRTA